MLNHQIGFSTAVEEVYKPISGRISDPDSAKPEGNPEGIQACEQYRDVVAELQATLKPELEMIETRIIGPADELLKIINSIRKMATKRDHKQLDLDRHTASLTKLQNKKERTVKDEKNLYTSENNVEIATQEYDYYNDMLKEELPKLFKLEADFIRPLFQSFYYMQLNIFYTLYTRMEEMKIPYFDLTVDINTSFEAKRGNIQEETEAIAITHFRVGQAKSKLDMTRRKFGKEAEAGKAGEAGVGAPGEAAPPPYGYPPSAEAYGEQAPAGYQQPAYAQQPVYGQQPAYGQPAGQPSYAQPVYAQQPAAVPGYAAPGTLLAAGAPAYGDVKAPIPAAAPAAAAVEYCIALYDYVPQAQGDLAIKAGETIEIVQRSADANGWWTGKVNGQVGVFPGNYVQLR